MRATEEVVHSEPGSVSDRHTRGVGREARPIAGRASGAGSRCHAVRRSASEALGGADAALKLDPLLATAAVSASRLDIRKGQALKSETREKRPNRSPGGSTF